MARSFVPELLLCEFSVYAAINALQNVETGPIYARVIIVDGWFARLVVSLAWVAGTRVYRSAHMWRRALET